MRLHIQYEYPAPPEQVYAALTDLDYVMAKSADSGDIDITVVERGQTAEGLKTVIRRTVAMEVPAFAKKLVSPKNVLTQTDVWPDATPDGVRVGTWEVETKGVPVTMTGTMTLRPAPGGTTTSEIDGEIASSVPLVGGKLAAFVAKEAQADLDKEHAFVLRWLKERG